MKEECSISTKEIGERIKDVRNYLLMTQQQVSEKTGVPVLSISKIEHGKKNSSISLARLLIFCSKYISLDFLFANDFTIGNAENYIKSFSMSTIVKARLEMTISDMNTSFEKTRKMLEQQLKETTKLI